MFSAENNEVRGLKFVEALGMGRGVTAVIGSGGKSSLLNRLAMELRGGGGVPEHVRFSGRRKGTSEKGEHALKENNTL